MMLDCDTTVFSYWKFQLLLAQWFCSLVSFAAISSVKGYSQHHPLVYAMLIGLFVWLISMFHGVLLLLGRREKVSPQIELGYYGVFAILTFAAFICAASSSMNVGPIKAAAAFLFFLILLLIASGYYTYNEMRESEGGQFTGILPTNNPSMASQDGGYSSPPSF